MGPLTVSPMGVGTWAWGNQLLWGYQESIDDELQEVFNLAVENEVNLFDTLLLVCFCFHHPCFYFLKYNLVKHTFDNYIKHV